MNEKMLKELRQIEKSSEDHKLHPEAIVDWARKHPKSEVYGWFDRGHAWDPAFAHEQYLLIEARRLIRLYVEVIPAPKGQPVNLEPVPIYVNPNPSRTSGGYQRIETVLDDPALHREWLLRILKDIRGRLRNASGLDELDPLREMVDQMISTFEVALP